MIKAAVDRDGNHGGESTVVALDLRQKIEFAVRGGNLEFHAVQDDQQDTRKKFISRVFKDNKLSQRLEYAMALYLTRGEILWLVLPSEDGGYWIDFFAGGATNPDEEYRVFYKPGGRKIDHVIITYPYKTSAPMGGFETERWVRLKISEDWIEQSDLAYKPNLRMSGMDALADDGLSNHQKYPNFFAPTIPVVICPNNPKRMGQIGSSDYHWLKNQIESHERDVAHIRHNLHFFGNPTLVTTRSTSEVIEAGDRGLAVPTWASQQGYIDGVGDGYSRSTRVSDPLTRHSGYGNAARERIAKIIGGVAQDERFGYILPDPITGDLNQFQRQERELLHWALGGIDPLGINSGATWGEIRTLFGRVQNTADGKADGLYTHGLALVFEQILYFEEQLFKQSLFMGMLEAEPKRWKKLVDPSQISDEIAQAIYQAYQEGKVKLSQEPQGMMPLGDRTVNWRYTRPVFKNTTRELLDLSIASRNAREDGLSQEYCLRMQHPDMTDKEIQDVMAGFSPRVVENAGNSLNLLVQLYQQFMQMPDPQNPQMPWGIRLGIGEMLDQALLTLQKELQYGKPTYDPAIPNPTINESTAELQLRRSSGDVPATTTNGAAAANGSTATAPSGYYPAFSPTASMVAYGLPPTVPIPQQPPGGYSQGSGLPQGTGQPIIPAPGATVASNPGSVFVPWYGADSTSSAPGIPAGIPAEFISNPYLWSLYAPNSGDGDTTGFKRRKRK